MEQTLLSKSPFIYNEDNKTNNIFNFKVSVEWYFINVSILSIKIELACHYISEISYHVTEFQQFRVLNLTYEYKLNMS